MTRERNPDSEGGVRRGSRVRISYRCFDETGTLIEETAPGEAPELVVGDGSLLEALEDALEGMMPGQTRELVLEPERAFGPYQEELVGVLDGDLQTDEPPPEPGDWLEIIEDDEDDPTPARVVSVEEDGIIVDANHPLAGRTLRYELRLEAILA